MHFGAIHQFSRPNSRARVRVNDNVSIPYDITLSKYPYQGPEEADKLQRCAGYMLQAIGKVAGVFQDVTNDAVDSFTPIMLG